ncbi:MAG: CHASE2 domain-containing protein, partial [Cyanobacteria bacterium J06649_4]
ALDLNKLPQLHPNSGGYTRANIRGTQMLMNFCQMQKPYDTIALRDVVAGTFDRQKVRDRVVIIGKTATYAKNSFITSAVKQTLYTQQIAGHLHSTKIIYGVEIHGHATEQIISFALNNTGTLSTWKTCGEYFWIVIWGVFGMSISVLLRSPWRSILTLVGATTVLGLISYCLLTQGFWIPFVPAALALCSAGLITAFFDRDMRFELSQRRATIEQTYEALHTGPLQRLADISRSLQPDVNEMEQTLFNDLQAVNNDMRHIFENLRRDTVALGHSLRLSENIFLDLNEPLSDLLYQVYEHTISQPLPGFESVQTFVTPVFEVLNNSRLGRNAKRGLCLFLQEALLNVGNHAIDATRLSVYCTVEPKHYRLQIIDNGIGLNVRNVQRQGTRQARAIARQLNGQFRRRSNTYINSSENRGSKNGTDSTEIGTICELFWPS